jgi:hypothetical protein
MPVPQDPAILEAIQNRRKASDEITRILNKETKPATQDRARSLSNDLMSYNSNLPQVMRPQVADANQMFAQRRANEVKPQMDILSFSQQIIDAGGSNTKAIQDSFGMFADNPEDLAKLWAAAEADPEEITPQNAATFAARKAQELGLRSVKRMQAENQQAFGEARLLAAEAKAAKEANNGVSWIGGGVPDAAAPANNEPLPTDASLIQGGGALLPPPVSATEKPDQTVFQGNPQAQPQAGSIEVNGTVINPELFKQGIGTARSLGSDAKIAAAAEKYNLQTTGRYKSAMDMAAEAQKSLQTVGSAREALNQLIAEKKSTGIVQNFLGTIGNDPRFELIERAKASLAMKERVPGTGAVSNFDAQQLVNQVVAGSKSPEYNRLVMAFIEASSTNAQQYADFLQWYVNAFGSENGAQNVWEKFRKENPMIRQVGNSPQPEYLSGFNADWREWVKGGQKVGQPDLKSKYGLE